jgi:hypothetical protein
MERSEKVRENRIRRKLHRLGYCLVKSKRKDPDAFDYGMYLITNENNHLVWGGLHTGKPDLTLDDVEEWIKEEVTQ